MFRSAIKRPFLVIKFSHLKEDKFKIDKISSFELRKLINWILVFRQETFPFLRHFLVPEDKGGLYIINTGRLTLASVIVPWNCASHAGPAIYTRHEIKLWQAFACCCKIFHSKREIVTNARTKSKLDNNNYLDVIWIYSEWSLHKNSSITPR